MVQFILGKSGSGKTVKIHDMIEDKCRDGQVILFVPEQFTYETEKKLFKRLGAKLFMNVTVTSFTRFSGEVFKLFGGISGEYATESAKVIMMEVVINTLHVNLEIYKKSSRSKSFSTTLLDTVAELKNAGISDEKLSQALSKLDKDSYLYRKTSEISMLYSAFNAKLYSAYRDPLDNISRATKKLQNTNYFSDYTVFLDEFKGFTANENDILRLIFKTSKDVFVSLCIDSERVQQSDYSVFASVAETHSKLMRFCREENVSIRPPIKLTEQYRFHNAALKHLEDNLLNPVVRRFDGEKNNSVTAILCKNEYDEVDYVLSTINLLVENEEYQYNDIAVISREMDTYSSKLAIACEKYSVPFYSDNRVKITTKPLIRFVKLCFECVLNGYQTSDLLALLKCGLTGHTADAVAELENYTFVWNTKKKQWFEPFTNCPRGFSDETTDEDTKVLLRINQLREFITVKLKVFENEIKQEKTHVSAQPICVALLNLLEEFKIKDYIEKLIEGLSTDGELIQAQDHLRVWEILIELIDTLAIVTADEKIDAKQIYKMYNLICDTYDMGTLPQSLDCVIIGSADRIRIGDKRAVFVLGVNENVFPFNPPGGGVFTNKERELLISLELCISPPVKDRIIEERFIAYKTLTSPSERLYITARKADITGKSMSPSEIFYQLERMFGEDVVSDTEKLSGEYFCRSKPTAFSYLARRYFDDTSLNSTLKSILSKDTHYSHKLALLNKITERIEFRLTDDIAKQVFGQNMHISPTRVEGYHQCAFRYFCEHGLKVRALRRAELNPLETGTLIHAIIYSITKSVDLKNDFEPVKIKGMIKSELDRYITDFMGGIEDKTSRFLYLYNRMRESIFKVIERLHDELSQSSFTPCEYEFEISENSAVKPLILTAQNGARIIVSGKVDRIDSYQDKQGKKFIRIVDYKSGKKVFSLDDVYNGLNLQMLIYLFCIQHNGQDCYAGTIPAGILYMPASDIEPELGRDASDSEIKSLKARHYKMNGLILNDSEVIDAMDKSSKGVYIPITRNNDGSFSKKSIESLATLKELAKIDRYIQSLIIRMADELHNGEISAYPMENICTYCDYSSVCGRGEHTKIKQCQKFKREQIISEMESNTDLKLKLH